jgi:hypothetical protein
MKISSAWKWNAVSKATASRWLEMSVEERVGG